MAEGAAAAVIDVQRLEAEHEAYQNWLESRIEEAYVVASQAKANGLDFKETIEIPRAADLASRTEKLLEDPYLCPNPKEPNQEPLRIQSLLRELLDAHDRETAAITISLSVTRQMFSRTGDKRRSIDSGLRVGLAVLTEAVLVAPLDGIGNVRILNNADGSEFLSIDFCGPIRAAGGTAQALGVLIGDILRRELGIGRYYPTVPEVERVKEEFGLYRMNLQYKPPPEETEVIVNACPVMINGEETERMECAGYKEVKNVVNENGSYRTRVRGGVMLVIGEGLCLKAPKIQTHTERLEVPGWEFISQFADKGKPSGTDDAAAKRRVIPKQDRYMGDVIAGRPIFGEPGEPGGFRLRYGRSRATGLAAAGLNPTTMEVMGGFLSVGTQMKIEGPGKACAVTPCIDIEGPTVLLKDGSFLRINTSEEWGECEGKVASIWDSGEILLGFGEFFENNKRLVPASYSKDWWASDVAEVLDHHDKVQTFAGLLGVERRGLPLGLPFNGAINRSGEDSVERAWRRRDWFSFLRRVELTWAQARGISESLGTAIPPPWNLWWSDLPIQFLPALIESLMGIVTDDDGSLRLKGLVEGWPFDFSDGDLGLDAPLLGQWPRWTAVREHGVVKSALMTLGIEHRHDGSDIIIPAYWEGLVEGLGLELVEDGIRQRAETAPHIDEILRRTGTALTEVGEEDKRGEGHTAEYWRARGTLDDYEVERSLMVVRKVSGLRWEDAVPCRIGARMGRPEKSGVREMKPLVHCIYPIGESGGPQRLLSQASSRGPIRVEMGPRVCSRCGRETPHLICHNRPDSDQPVECGGRTSPRRARRPNARRRGERTTVSLSAILEVKRRALGLEKIPEKIKAVKGLISTAQTPEPIEKGILRAKHGVSVFRDGTSRYDMSDVPVTHFRPCEIGTSWKELVKLGYTHDTHGNVLKSNEQMIELLPQDFIPSISAVEHLLSTCAFVDDLLVRFYGMEAFYRVKSAQDIVGHIAIGLAPHTSGGVACRIIGWTKASAGYAHPLFHAAKRRNCDGDEDSIMMLLDGLLNFTREILPDGRGGRMDAPLVLTTRLNPSEIDKEALNVDCSWGYTRAFYEATLSQPHSRDVRGMVDLVEDRLGTIGDLRGYGWTHDSGPLDAGPQNSAYKTLVTMKDKLSSQLDLGSVLRSVNVDGVAKQVIESHFLPDLRGNMMAFTRQKVRCVKCGESYRRMPLAGKCIKESSQESGGFSIGGGAESSMCGGNVVLTVSQGAVRKYIEVTQEIMDEYGVDDYTRHRVNWMTSSVDSLFTNDRVTVMTLEDFI